MKKENCAVFPGSFDPITLGHKDVICRAIPLFDKIYVAIGDNIDKKYMFPIEKRLEWLQIAFKNFPSIEVAKFDGLTIDFCNKHNINFILRGLRTSADFEFERQIAQINKQLNQKIETIFFLTHPTYTSLNSSIVREIISYNGDISNFVPAEIIDDLLLTYKNIY